MTLPGAAGGARLAAAVVATALLAFFAVLLARLDMRLSAQEDANRRTLAASGDVVSTNRSITARVAEVAALAEGARTTAAATSALTPVLAELRDALAAVSAPLGSVGGGAAASGASLRRVASVLDDLRAKTAALSASASGLPAQEGAVVGELRRLAADLGEALADARRVRQLFDPGPPA